MKVLLPHEKLERFKRSEFVRSDKNLSAMAPSLDMLV
jgi:hypothetical protein